MLFVLPILLAYVCVWALSFVIRQVHARKDGQTDAAGEERVEAR
jgi:hypothetical protein